MAQAKKLPAKPDSAPPPVKGPDQSALLTDLPALGRLLEAAAEWLEGINETRREHSDVTEEAEEALRELGDNPEASFGRERENDVTSRPFNPQSLVGSWFHKLDDKGAIEMQGSVVADVAPPGQPGIYLCELHQWKDGASAYQRLFTLKQMAEPDDGGSWRFYDEDEWMRLADQRRKAMAIDNVDRTEVT